MLRVEVVVVYAYQLHWWAGVKRLSCRKKRRSAVSVDILLGFLPFHTGDVFFSTKPVLST